MPARPDPVSHRCYTDCHCALHVRPGKYALTISADCLDASLKLEFDRKPETRAGSDCTVMFKEWGYKWQPVCGYWKGKREAIEMFEDKVRLNS